MKLSEEFTIFVGKTNGTMCNGLERLSISSFNDNASKILNSIEKYEKQLEEKDKEIEDLKNHIITEYDLKSIFDKELKNMIAQQFEDGVYNRLLNKKAIEELEKVDKILDSNIDCNGFVDYTNVSNYLQNRIVELKGEK